MNAVRLARQWIEFWRIRFPSPQPVLYARPEIAFTVLIQIDDPTAKSTILAVALNTAIPNHTEATSRNPHSASPYRAFSILKELENILIGKLRVRSQLTVLPTGKPLRGAYPKRPVARGEQAPNLTGGKRLIRWRLPGDCPNPIEAKQAGFCTQPEITVGRLSNRADDALRKSFADLP